jgi:LexA-binding, inner membrane-associated putative hydrolase
MVDKLFILSANALAAFMDFGIGTAIAALVAYSYDVSLPWYLLFFGGILALVPDFDLVPSVFRGISPTFDHRQTPFHRPLLVLPLVVVIAYQLGGEMWLMIASICVFGHYLHDTNFIGTSYGLAWFWPFSKQYWSIFGSYEPELPKIGYHHEWLKQNWLQPSVLSVREIGAGVIGLSIAMWMSGVSFFFISAFGLLVITSVGLLWRLYRIDT